MPPGRTPPDGHVGGSLNSQARQSPDRIGPGIDVGVVGVKLDLPDQAMSVNNDLAEIVLAMKKSFPYSE